LEGYPKSSCIFKIGGLPLQSIAAKENGEPINKIPQQEADDEE
jgi:hypothetical protein